MVISNVNDNANATGVSMNQLDYRVVSTAEIAQLSPAFDAFAYMDTSFTWLLSTIDYILAHSLDIHWHCLADGDQIYIALPLSKMQHSGFSQYTSLISFYANSIRPLYFCAEQHNELFSTLLRTIQQQKNWHQLRLGPINEGEDLHQAVKATVPLTSEYARSKNWYNRAVSDFEAFYQSRPSQLRNTIARRQKKLTKTHQWSIEYVTDEKSFQQLFSAYQTIYTNSWKQPEYSLEFIRSVCLSALANQQLRMAVLFVDEQPAAAQIWFLAHGKVSIFKLAYDDNYKSFSVGSILSYSMFKAVIEQDKIQEIEYGTGDEAYKRDWMSQSRQRITVDIYNAHTLRGRLLYVFKRIKQRFKRQTQ